MAVAEAENGVLPPQPCSLAGSEVVCFDLNIRVGSSILRGGAVRWWALSGSLNSEWDSN